MVKLGPVQQLYLLEISVFETSNSNKKICRNRILITKYENKLSKKKYY